MTKEKKKPARLCVACREMREKNEFIRITKSKDGVISLDPTGKMPGRGAYICKSQDCFAKAKKSRALERAFSTKVADEIYDELSAALAEVCDGE